MAKSLKQNRRKDEIIEAACKVFSDIGFFRADMNLIAKEANIAKGTVYLYFPSKKELFLEIIKNGLFQLAGRVEKAIKNVENPLDELKKSIVAYIKFFEENEYYYRILLHPDKEMRDEIEKTWLNYTLSKIPSVEDTLNKGIKQGYLRDIDSHTTSYMILGMIDQTIGLWISKKENVSIQNLTDQLLELIIKGIRK